MEREQRRAMKTKHADDSFSVVLRPEPDIFAIFYRHWRRDALSCPTDTGNRAFGFRRGGCRKRFGFSRQMGGAHDVSCGLQLGLETMHASPRTPRDMAKTPAGS